jgi:hypothetical protein
MVDVRLVQNVFVAILAGILAIVFSGGCSARPVPDVEMVSAPTGLWIGESQDITLDIQSGGFIKITSGSAERTGSWKPIGENALRVTLDGQVYEMTYTRQDLSLEMTLPGEARATRFTQM